MKKITKLALALSFLAISVTSPFVTVVEAVDATAATGTGYTSASQVEYVKNGKYIANWGAREEDCVFLSTYAQDFYTGNNTYANLSQKRGSATKSEVPSTELYQSLQTLMSSKQTYQTSYNATRDLFRYTDCLQGDYSKISSFYSGELFNSAWDGGSTWNREHTWPNSKGDASGNGENDIMMLRPTIKTENGSRGNTAYGESASYYNPDSHGQSLHGDCARIILYVYVRWGCTNTGSNYNPSDIFDTKGVIESLSILLKWMQEDPVDTWEMGRNDAVQAITGTRNVFVDYPEYAWLLFGKSIPSITTPSGIAKNGSGSTNDSSSTNNSSDSTTSNNSSSSSTQMGSSAILQILQAAYELSHNEYLPGTYKLTGVVTQITKVENGNTCLYLVIGGFDEYPLYCRWLQNVDDLQVGDTITVRGQIRRYDQYVEFENPTLVTGDVPSDSSQSSLESDSSAPSAFASCTASVGIPFGALLFAVLGCQCAKKRKQ